MNWEAVSVVADVVAAIAVVATLIYLSAQVRQNSKVSKAATRQAISDSATEAALNFFPDHEFRRAFNANIGGEELDDDQYLYLQAYCYICFRRWENIHFQYREGMLSDGEWASFRINLKTVCQIPIWQEYWKLEGGIYTEEFRLEIDAILREIAVEPPVQPGSLVHPRGKRS